MPWLTFILIIGCYFTFWLSWETIKALRDWYKARRKPGVYYTPPEVEKYVKQEGGQE